MSRKRCSPPRSRKQTEVTSTTTATSTNCIAALSVKRKRGRFSKISPRKTTLGDGRSSRSPVRRLSPTSLNWPKAASTVERKASTNSSAQAAPISSSVSINAVNSKRQPAYPQRCSSPCRMSCRTSPSKSNPCSAACRAACSTETTTSPRLNPSPFSNSSCPEGNDNTSVVPTFPRQRRFNSRIALSDTNATVAPAPFAGTTFKALSANARQRSQSIRTLRWRLTTSAIKDE
jgi:hypothetical protein